MPFFNIFYHFLENLWTKIRFRFNYLIISDHHSQASFVVIGNATGRNPYCRTYLRQRDKPKVEVRWFSGNIRLISELSKKYGMVVLADKAVPEEIADSSLLVPNFLSLAISIPEDIPAYFKTISASMRSNIRLLEKRNFTWKISTDRLWAKEFYWDYYRRTMIQSHGDEAYVYAESVVQDMLSEPGAEFLQIFDGELCVGGALCQNKDGIYHIVNMGWYQGNPELRNKNVPSAFFWYSICRSMSLGCRLVNCGGSPPYLENGVTRFKLPWGATYCKELSNYGDRSLFLNPADDNCLQFLTENSIIGYNRDRQLIVLSARRPEEINLPRGFLKDIKAWFLLRTDPSNYIDAMCKQHLPVSLSAWYEYYEPVQKSQNITDSERVGKESAPHHQY